VASSQEDSTGSLPLPNDMAGSGCAENAILSYQQLLDSVGSANLGDQLYYLGVVIASISSDDKKAAVCAFWNRQQNAGDERFAVVRLLEDCDLLPKSRSRDSSSQSV